MRYSPKALRQLERIERRMKAGEVSVARAFELSQEVMDADQQRRAEPQQSEPRAVCSHCGRELN